MNEWLRRHGPTEPPLPLLDDPLNQRIKLFGLLQMNRMSSLLPAHVLRLWHMRFEINGVAGPNEMIVVACDNEDFGDRSRDLLEALRRDAVRQASIHLRDGAYERLGTRDLCSAQV